MKSAYTILEGVATYTGSVTTAGLLMYIVVMLMVLVFMKSYKTRFFFIAMPITLIMAALGILKSDVMYLLLIFNLIGVLIQFKKLR